MSHPLLCLNQATVETTPTTELLAHCARHGITQVSLWRHQYVDGSAALTRARADEHGVQVTGLCRGGFLSGTRPVADAVDDNRRAVDEAVALGAPVLVIVCGPVVDGDLAASVEAIADGIGRLLPHARAAGITLAVEPFHPMFAAERSAIVTVGQAADLLERFPGQEDVLGVALDTYHLWWDPDLDTGLTRLAGRVAGIHVADWLVPTPELLAGRGLPGDGVIDLPGLLRRFAVTGYRGPVEVEVLNREIWARDLDELLTDVVARTSTLLTGMETS